MKHIVTIALILFWCNGVGSVWQHVFSGKCSNRYEFRNDMPKIFPELSNCSFVREKLPMCAQEIIVSYSERPPYVVYNKTKKIPQGLLPGMLRLAMQTCCYKCANLKFIGPYDDVQKYFANSTKVVMPIESAKTSEFYSGYHYVPFLDVPGVTILARSAEDKTKKLSKHLMLSVLGTWPLFVVAFTMAAIAGCVVWVLDTWFNKDEFPSSFPRGPFEGFWWAFVSMTTVGYGDRAPKSIVARLFAVLWILLGMTIFSLYTATLTSALTNNMAMYESESIYGRNIGALDSTAAGVSAAVQKNAVLFKYENVEKMIEALSSGELYGIALDDNILNYYYDKIKEKISDIRIHSHLPIKHNSYGVLVFNDTLSEFIRSFFESNEDNKITMMSVVLNAHWPNKTPVAHEIETESIFSPKSPIFLGTIITLLVTGVVTIAVGLTCKWFFKRHDDALRSCIRCQQPKSKKKDIELDQMIPNGHSNLEEEFSKELDELKMKWMKKFMSHTNGNA